MFATATRADGFSWVDSLGHFVASFAAAFAGAQNASRLYRELSSLSEAQLATRGLVREDVNRMTLQALNNSLNS